ncbi:MAG: hypothetical protein AB8B61_03570 [Cyclobacteriaceae bacterium]
MDNFYKIQDRRIKREEISTLLFSMGGDISTHSLSMYVTYWGNVLEEVVAQEYSRRT